MNKDFMDDDGVHGYGLMRMIMIIDYWVKLNTKKKILRTLMVISGVKNGISLLSFRSPITIAINIILILINPLDQSDILLLLNAGTSWASK